MATEKKEKPEAKLEPKSVKVRITFTAPVLGTAPNDPDLYSKFIATRAAEPEKTASDEIASLPSKEDLEETSRTVFHRTEDGIPMLYDYQIKGMIKEAWGAMTEFGVIKVGRSDVSKYNVKRIVDNFIFVYPREIPLIMPTGETLTECVRPLRAETLRGPRIALTCSEKAPKGTVIELSVEWLNPGMEKHVIAALEYGSKKGIGQWRNSGMGRFSFEVIG